MAVGGTLSSKAVCSHPSVRLSVRGAVCLPPWSLLSPGTLPSAPSLGPLHCPPGSLGDLTPGTLQTGLPPPAPTFSEVPPCPTGPPGAPSTPTLPATRCCPAPLPSLSPPASASVVVQAAQSCPLSVPAAPRDRGLPALTRPSALLSSRVTWPTGTSALSHPLPDAFQGLSSTRAGRPSPAPLSSLCMTPPPARHTHTHILAGKSSTLADLAEPGLCLKLACLAPSALGSLFWNTPPALSLRGCLA